MNESARGYGKTKKFSLPSGTMRPMTEQEIKEKGWDNCK